MNQQPPELPTQPPSPEHPEPPGHPLVGPPPAPMPGWAPMHPVAAWPGASGKLAPAGFRSITGLGEGILCLFYVLAAMFGAIAGAQVIERSILTDPDPSEGDLWMPLFLIAGWQYLVRWLLVVGLITFVAVIVWIRRSQSNLVALGAPQPGRRALISVVLWLIPPANVVLGLLLLRNIWTRSGSTATPLHRKGHRGALTLHLWWGCLVAGSPVFAYGIWDRGLEFRESERALDEELRGLDILLTGSVLLALACLGAAATFRTLSERQHVKAYGRPDLPAARYRYSYTERRIVHPAEGPAGSAPWR